MPDLTNNRGHITIQGETEPGVSARILQVMASAVALAVLASLFVSPWRVTTGLLLGGGLSLLSYYWMSNSIASAFNVSSAGLRPQIKLATYILRYFVIAFVVYAAYKLNVISLPAALAGMCSFVVGLFAEALRGLYLTIVHREEIS